MDRQQYIQYRKRNDSTPLYEFYKENHKGGIFLQIGEFFQAISIWPFAPQAFAYVLQQYDIKFDIVTLYAKNGQVIKYI